jgi:hypothetical protein
VIGLNQSTFYGIMVRRHVHVHGHTAHLCSSARTAHDPMVGEAAAFRAVSTAAFLREMAGDERAPELAAVR